MINNKLISLAYKLDFKSYFGRMLKICDEHTYLLWMHDLKDWLREQYELIIIIDINRKLYDYHVYTFSENLIQYMIQELINYTYFSKYEECLEKALFESIKYINQLNNK